jgi:hypothetical protein
MWEWLYNWWMGSQEVKNLALISNCMVLCEYCLREVDEKEERVKTIIMCCMCRKASMVCDTCSNDAPMLCRLCFHDKVTKMDLENKILFDI